MAQTERTRWIHARRLAAAELTNPQAPAAPALRCAFCANWLQREDGGVLLHAGGHEIVICAACATDVQAVLAEPAPAPDVPRIAPVQLVPGPGPVGRP